MKKILFFTDKISYSGASKIICWLVNTLKIKNCTISLVTHMNFNDQRQINNNVKRIVLNNNYSNKYLHGIKTIIKLRKLIKMEKYNLCIGFLPTECLYLRIATLFLKTKIIVCERSDPYFEKSFISNIGRYSFRFADGAVFQTREAQMFFPKKIQQKSIIIPNPVLNNKYKAIPYEKRNYEIATSGRLFVKQKRQDLLLQAFKKVVDKNDKIILKIYGDGPDINKLKELTKELSINKKVFFVGKTDDVERQIGNSKIFILTSDYEGIPNSIIEAMQQGIAVVSTDCSPGGAKVLIENGYNGYIVPRNNDEEIAKKILYLLNHPKKLKEMSLNNLIKVKEFDENKILLIWKQYITKYL